MLYPAASRDKLKGKNSLVCTASDMFPSRVQFLWKRQKENGPMEELFPEEGDQLEVTERQRTTAILNIHQPENTTYKYRCDVKHEKGIVKSKRVLEITVLRPPPPPPPSPSLQSECRVKQLCVLYIVLMVKSLVYFFGLSVIRIVRNGGSSTSHTRDD